MATMLRDSSKSTRSVWPMSISAPEAPPLTPKPEALLRSFFWSVPAVVEMSAPSSAQAACPKQPLAVNTPGSIVMASAPALFEAETASTLAAARTARTMKRRDMPVTPRISYFLWAHPTSRARPPSPQSF